MTGTRPLNAAPVEEAARDKTAPVAALAINALKSSATAALNAPHFAAPALPVFPAAAKFA